MTHFQSVLGTACSRLGGFDSLAEGVGERVAWIINTPVCPFTVIGFGRRRRTALSLGVIRRRSKSDPHR